MFGQANNPTWPSDCFCSRPNPGDKHLQCWCSVTPTTVWKARTQHAYKVNFDGATFAEEGLAGLGVVIRNEQ